MSREELLSGNMPDFMREAHALITMQFAYDEEEVDEEEKDAEIHALMDSFTDPHGVMMYMASYIKADFPTAQAWQHRLIEVEEVFRGNVA